jgi:16S rRNA (cytosine1402-N4)-methyltransferase
MASTQRKGASGEEPPVHVPVLRSEVVELLAGPGAATLEGWIVDGTLGAGGHAAALLEACPRARLIGIDQDPEVLAHARRRLARFGSRARLRHARVSTLDRVLHEEGATRVVALLLDLGASSLQLDHDARGFSFAVDAPLDMRMDPDRARTAADIVNRWDEADLADLFLYEGGEPRARKVARALVEARRRAPFLRTLALADLIERTLGRGGARAHLHPATRVFQALRRAVNEEGDELRAGLALAEAWLVDGGRLAVISFHSGEDGTVKRFLAEGARSGRWRLVTRKPVRAPREEVLRNRRARSAVLRCAERTRRGGPAAGQHATGQQADRRGGRTS